MATALVVSDQTSLQDRRGDEIWFKGNALKRFGHVDAAWIDTGRQATPCYYYIIVSVAGELEANFRVKKDLVIQPPEPPRTYIQAAFQQHPDLEAAVDSLARKLAECRIQNSSEITSLIGQAMDKAFIVQLNKGNKARY